MKKAFVLGGLLIISLLGSAGADEPVPLQLGAAPKSDGLFAPLLADPRELQFTLRVAFPEQAMTTAEVAIGHYYGIYRWAIPNGLGYTQVNIGGGIFPRFNFPNNRDLQVIDFYGNIPFDIRVDKWSGRFMFYHVSSHLGDDYIRVNNQIAEKNSWNSIRSIVSYDAAPSLRLYGGHTLNLLVHPSDQKHQAFQSGFELRSNVFDKSRAQAYWANDFQWWERTNWKTMFNSQLGIKSGPEAKYGRGISYFLEFTKGPEYYGQFFTHNETRLGVGAKFDID